MKLSSLMVLFLWMDHLIVKGIAIIIHLVVILVGIILNIQTVVLLLLIHIQKESAIVDIMVPVVLTLQI